MVIDKLELKVDVSEALNELEEFQIIMKHYNAIPILIEAVRDLPNAQEVLAEWDKARK